MKASRFIGIVTEIIDDHNFVFHANNDYKCQLQQVVGLNITDNTFVLANITHIDVGYFLKDKEEYFTSLSVSNKLQELSSGIRNPKMATKLKATYLGIYEYDNVKNKFFESILSIDVYTPSVFQEVVSFDFDSIETIYGLKQSTEKYFRIGKFLYPNYLHNAKFPDVNISPDTFNSHTLISGVTGSGKSRLAMLITNQLASSGGHITIVDPHDEYMKFANTKTAKVFFFSRSGQLHNGKRDIHKRDLSFTNSCITPQILTKLLPELSPQQRDYVYNVFEKNIAIKDITIETITGLIFKDFKSEFIMEGLNVTLEKKENNSTIKKDKLILANEYATKDNQDQLTYFNRYVSCLSKDVNSCNKVGKLHVVYAVLKKILTIYEANLFPYNSNLFPPSWLDTQNRNSINIMNLDYDSNTNIRRFINTIIQCFFTPLNNIKNYRMLIIDEAHLLLNDKPDETGTAILLNRLLRESRKFGLSIVFITQNEVDIPEEIISQFQNKFRFREEKDQELKYLGNQTCLCSIYKGKLSFPMRVDNVEEII
jgi:Predicted ATPase